MSLQQTQEAISPTMAHSSVAALLHDDHERLERRFQSIIAAAEDGDPESLRASWRAFESDLSGHLDAEEVHILPVMARDQPHEAHALLEEHLQIRAKLMALGIDLDLHCLRTERIEAFVAELRAHAHREDQLLYPWAEKRLGPGLWQQLRAALGAVRDKPPATSEEP